MTHKMRATNETARLRHQIPPKEHLLLYIVVNKEIKTTQTDFHIAYDVHGCHESKKGYPELTKLKVKIEVSVQSKSREYTCSIILSWVRLVSPIRS